MLEIIQWNCEYYRLLYSTKHEGQFLLLTPLITINLSNNRTVLLEFPSEQNSSTETSENGAEKAKQTYNKLQINELADLAYSQLFMN